MKEAGSRTFLPKRSSIKERKTILSMFAIVVAGVAKS